jgi:hypothetical protein
MKCRKNYKDKEKYRKYRNGYNERYYKRTQDAENSRLMWNEEEIRIILNKEKSDTELAKLLGRSVKAIQIKRTKVLREREKDEKNTYTF